MSLTEIVMSLIDDVSGTLEGIVGNSESAFESIANSSDIASGGLDDIGLSAEEADAALGTVDGTPLDGISGNAENAASSVDDISRSADDASGSVNELGASGTALDTFANIAVADQLKQGATAAQDFADQAAALNTQIGQTGIRTGMTSDEVRNYALQVSDANINTSEATAWIQRLGIAGFTTSGDISRITNDMKVLSNATGLSATDTESLVVSLGKAGVPIDNLGASYNALGYMMQHSNVKMIDFTAFLSRNSAGIKENGLNVDQLALMYPALIKHFGTAKKASAGFNQIMKDSGGDISKVEQALGLEAGSLSRANEITQQGSGVMEQLSGEKEKNVTVTQKLKAVYDDVSTSLSGILGPIASVAGGLGTMGFAIFGLQGAYGVLTTAKVFLLGATEAETGATTVGIVAKILDSEATVAGTVAKGAAAVATGVVTAATWLWNIALEANPIGIVVIAIVALIAILYYLYNNNETVRNAINALWGGLQVLGSYIMGGLIAAWNALMVVLSPITSALGRLWGAVMKIWGAFAQGKSDEASGTFAAISSALQWLWSIMSQVAGYLISYFTPGFNILIQVLTAVYNVLMGAFAAAWTTISGVVGAVITFLAGFIDVLTGLLDGTMTFSEAMGTIWNLLKDLMLNVLLSVMVGIGQFSINLLQSGITAATGFVMGIIGYLMGLPGQMQVWFLVGLAYIMMWRAQLIAYAISTGSSFLSSIISFFTQLPGRMWSYLMSGLSYLSSFAGQAGARAGQAGSSIINTIGSYLASLPGRMYQWGISALSSFTNAIINSIPGLRGALDAVSSLFPHSPPKTGPLATVKTENMAKFGSSLTDAMGEGLEDGAGDSFSFIKGTKIEVDSRGDSGSKSSGTDKEVTLNLNVDLKNVPEGNDDKAIVKMLLEAIKDDKVRGAFMRMLTQLKREEKSNLGV